MNSDGKRKSESPLAFAVARQRATIFAVFKICLLPSSLPRVQFGGHMDALCARTDFLGRLGRYYFTGGTTQRSRRSPVTRTTVERQRRPRLSLRTLASYRTLLSVLLLYLLGALLSLGLFSSTGLILAVSFLYGLCMTALGEKQAAQ